MLQRYDKLNFYFHICLCSATQKQKKLRADSHLQLSTLNFQLSTLNSHPPHSAQHPPPLMASTPHGILPPPWGS